MISSPFLGKCKKQRKKHCHSFIYLQPCVLKYQQLPGGLQSSLIVNIVTDILHKGTAQDLKAEAESVF